jgi:hypothetical protein
MPPPLERSDHRPARRRTELQRVELRKAPTAFEPERTARRALPCPLSAAQPSALTLGARGHHIEELSDSRLIAQAVWRPHEDDAERPQRMFGSESPGGEARARARDDDRRIDPERVHVRRQVGSELLDPVARVRPVGVAMPALGGRECVDRQREMWEHALERPPRVQKGVKEDDRDARLVALLHVRQLEAGRELDRVDAAASWPPAPIVARRATPGDRRRALMDAARPRFRSRRLAKASATAPFTFGLDDEQSSRSSIPRRPLGEQTQEPPYRRLS